MPNMPPVTPDDQQVSNPTSRGPDPSVIQVAKPYVFEKEIQECLSASDVSEQKENTARLQGVSWIDSVRKALLLPVRTYDAACVYYHKFRLAHHQDAQWSIQDAAAAALFAACKIEDTLKKSRDILCAAYNLNRPASEHLSPDDPGFDSMSRTVVILERLMLESNGFDFRNRYPQKLLVKISKTCKFDRRTVGNLAWRVSIDLYRTFAPVKQTRQSMALACLELSARLCNEDPSKIDPEKGFDYSLWTVTRTEIMETMNDLLDLYTHHRNNTIVGPDYALDIFIQIRISLNQESASKSIPRYTNWREPDNASPIDNASQANGAGPIVTPTSISPQSPARAGPPGEKGKDGTVRFMLDPERSNREKQIVREFFRPEEKEWVEEYVTL